LVKRPAVFWIVAGTLSFWACARLGVTATPIDRALPWIALIVTAVAWLADSYAVQCAVPLMIAAAICFPDEHTRLTAYGAIVAVAFCGAIMSVEVLDFPRTAGFAIAGTALIRWIAREHFQFFREAIVLVGVIVIVAVAKKSRLTIALAMIAALYTPAIPIRTLAIPFLIAIVAYALRPLSPQSSVLSLLIIAIMLTLFPYSGILARTPRYLRYGKPAIDRVNRYWAMKPGESIDAEVPPGAHAVIVSLSNGARLDRHAVVGRLGDRELHAGDLADWGFARREQWWRSTNRLPRHAAGRIRGYGYDGWVDGAVRVAIPGDAKTIHVDVDPHLPPQTLLQVEAFER
jgi:hypothetical protein